MSVTVKAIQTAIDGDIVFMISKSYLRQCAPNFLHHFLLVYLKGGFIIFNIFCKFNKFNTELNRSNNCETLFLNNLYHSKMYLL